MVDYFERKNFRKIFDPTQAKGLLRISYNEQVYKLCVYVTL